MFLTWACAELWLIAESEDVRRHVGSGGLRYAVLLLLYGDVSMFLLLALIGPPPTLRPEKKISLLEKSPKLLVEKKKSPLDSLDEAFKSPELPFLVISFEYPVVVKRPARVVVGSSP